MRLKPRATHLLATILGGVALAGPLIMQALPELIPQVLRFLRDNMSTLVFVAAFAVGGLIGLQSTRIRSTLGMAVGAVVLGSLLAGFMIYLPALMGLTPDVMLVSLATGFRMFVTGLVLIPISVVGAFIGSALSSRD